MRGESLLPIHGGSESGPFLRASSRPPLSPVMRVSVPGPAAGREPSTPGGGRGGAVAAASGAAVPGSVQLALSIPPALLFAFACLQPRRLLLHRERRLSYQSLCLFPCLLWAALRTALCAPAFSLGGSLPLLLPPAHLHYFPHWLLCCFPSGLQFSTLSPPPLPGGDKAGGPAFADGRALRRRSGVGGASSAGRTGEQPGETEALLECAQVFATQT